MSAPASAGEQGGFVLAALNLRSEATALPRGQPPMCGPGRSATGRRALERTAVFGGGYRAALAATPSPLSPCGQLGIRLVVVTRLYSGEMCVTRLFVVSLTQAPHTLPRTPGHRARHKRTCPTWHSREGFTHFREKYNSKYCYGLAAVPHLQCADRTGLAAAGAARTHAAAASCTPRQRPQDLWERDNPGWPHA